MKVSEVVFMSQIQVTDLTFSYDGSADDVLRDVSFTIDTDWKLGLIGRNGKGGPGGPDIPERTGYSAVCR